MDFRLAPATLRDLAFIMATERLDGYDALVGRWDEARHREAFADGSHRYFIGVADGEPTGFALLRFWNAPERSTLVRRIAVVSPGKGQGRVLAQGAPAEIRAHARSPAGHAPTMEDAFIAIVENARESASAPGAARGKPRA